MLMPARKNNHQRPCSQLKATKMVNSQVWMHSKCFASGAKTSASFCMYPPKFFSLMDNSFSPQKVSFTAKETDENMLIQYQKVENMLFWCCQVSAVLVTASS